ncbi:MULTISPECIES: MarR family winged helix-turn-helix transcriptional regulator [Asaia]|uniref:MarR family transcriptional regulator n=2 Tax=Asaia TaxID=91914 RepID=A0ABQ1MG18_9PROT|nr:MULTISPECIES: MarR family transcriptional regulator [Asaia]GBR03637.1 MarR family transcriptional regulator [Asaia siamensis NRIC 0323]GBR12869.1 MarR family transcriptional regulator [Asaia spathodeae NBRC 105894]GGC38407.1 MarR family transcriptional regulator [Asaia siamensis]
MSLLADETPTLGRMMALIARRWRQILDAGLRPHDLTDATWQPLLELQRHGRPLHPKEIADALLLDKSSMVRILRTLEEKGFVTRTPDETDRRAFFVNLTEAGDVRLREVMRLSRAIEMRAIAGVAEEDLAATRRVLRAIHDEIQSVETSL